MMIITLLLHAISFAPLTEGSLTNIVCNGYAVLTEGSLTSPIFLILSISIFSLYILCLNFALDQLEFYTRVA